MFHHSRHLEGHERTLIIKYKIPRLKLEHLTFCNYLYYSMSLSEENARPHCQKTLTVTGLVIRLLLFFHESGFVFKFL